MESDSHSKKQQFQPKQIIDTSFNNFLRNNNYKNNQKLTRDELLNWNFRNEITNDILKNEFFLINNCQFDQCSIPSISSFLENHEKKLNGSLVRINCMIQNIVENQLFMSVVNDKKNDDKLLVNKYFEFEVENNQINQMEVEEDLLQEEDNIKGGVLDERLVLNCSSIPGINQSLCSKFEIPKEKYLKNKKLIIYDYENNQNGSYKINDEILVIGVAYERDNVIIIHSWILIKDFIKNSIKTTFLKPQYILQGRELIGKYIKEIFLQDDNLLSEYLTLFLCSQILARVGTIFIGKMNLNVILSNESANTRGNEINIFKNLISKIFSFINQIVNYSIEFNISIPNLKKNFLFPRFDVNTEELLPGLLQTLDQTFLLFDEIQMSEGNLDELGVKNYNCIKNLIEFNTMTYEYPYNKIEINHDSEILIFTQTTKSIFNSLNLLELPILLSQLTFEFLEESVNKMTDINSENHFPIKESDLELLCNWFNCVQYSDELKNFKIESEISNKIQQDFRDKRTSDSDSYSADDLDRNIRLSRLYAISHGRNELLFEDYLQIINMERERKIRLEKLKNINKSK
jgi:hypothetical protein